jgi:hypothetical protein
MKATNTMYTYISPFTSCSEVLTAAKQVSYETKFIRSSDALRAWEMNHDDLMSIVRSALYSNTYSGQDHDDLNTAYSILKHAIDIKVPRVLENL